MPERIYDWHIKDKEVRDMKGGRIKLKMSYDEIRVLVYALTELRNALIKAHKGHTL